MCRLHSLVYGIGFLWLLPSTMGDETAPDALPPGAVVRLGWSPLRIGYADFALTPDGKTIVVVTPQGNFRRLDAQTGRLLERRQLTDRSDVDPVGYSSARLSTNGQTVVIEERSYTGSRLTVYDIASGKQMFRRESTEKDHIVLGRLSPDGKQLAVVEAESPEVCPARVRVFDLKQGCRLELGKMDNYINELHFSGDGKRLLIDQSVPPPDFGSSNNPLGSLRLVISFDLSSGKELWRRRVWGANFAISRDGKMVIGFGFRDRKSREPSFQVVETNGDAAKPTERFLPCRLDSAQVSDYFPLLALTSDDRTIALCRAKEIVLWDLRGRKVMRRFPLPKVNDADFSPLRMAVSADSRTLLLSNGVYLQRLDLTTGKSYFALPDNGLPSSFLDLAFTPDGKELFAAAYGGITGRWNAATGKKTDMIRGENYGSTPFIRTPDGLRALRYEYRPGHVDFSVVDPIAGKTLHTISCLDLAHLESDGLPVNPDRQTHELAANGKTILAIRSSRKNSYVTAWNAETGTLLSRFTVPVDFDWPSSPFSPCGRWAVLGGNLYHVGSGTELFAPAGHRGERLSGERLMDGNQRKHGPMWFSIDGRFLAAHLRKADAKSAAEDVLAVWELASGQVWARFAKCGFVAHVAFAPDGRTIALLDGRGVRLMDMLSEKPLTAYSAPDVICGGTKQGLVFAPDGATLATAHEDGSILLWKVPRCRPVHSPALLDGEAEKLWKDLGSSSPAAARAALERLVCHPAAATDLLAKRFRLPPVDGMIAALIKDLDNDEFVRREGASRKLRAYGAGAEMALRRALAQNPSLELKRRIESLLADRKPLRLPFSGDRLRGVRAIEVLERIGNTAARKLLQSWAEQTEDGHLALEARIALERLTVNKTQATAAEKQPSP